jgi:16S rRNA (cytosine967-C5)-methyltransferase
VASDSTRLTAIKIMQQLLLQKGSLSTLLDKYNPKEDSENKALLQAICYGLCRHYEQLDFISKKFINKPLRKKDKDIHCLILIGVYQLFFMRMPDYAIINESVATCSQLKKVWAKKLVNAVLRSVQREMDSLTAELDTRPEIKYSHPAWLISLLKKDWPEDYQSIMQNNNQQAPMTLRVNKANNNIKQYQSSLEQAQIHSSAGHLTDTALILHEPVLVNDLPGFSDGIVSVQDEASQLAISLLNPMNNEIILDACAAPGGKSCAILERTSGVSLYAVDNDALRLKRVEENLERTQTKATLIHKDIIEQANIWQRENMLFDRILLDVPCSATGVIRRHPDIKLLRQPEDINKLAPLQQDILNAVWPLLKKGGILLYSTCSVLKTENSDQLLTFISSTNDAQEVSIKASWGVACEYGRQLLPMSNSHDGFYYALLQKC